jgi:hypothetical protein
MRLYLEKLFTKIGLVKWLKVKPLSSSSSTAKQTKQNNTKNPKTQQQQKDPQHYIFA